MDNEGLRALLTVVDQSRDLIVFGKFKELGIPQVARDEAANSRDKAPERVAPQPAQAASSTLTDATHRCSTTSCSPDLDCNMMKSFDGFPNQLKVIVS